MMLERIKRCLHCRRRMCVAPGAYSENPYCVGCLRERLEKAKAETGLVEWRIEGNTMVPVRKDGPHA